MVHRCWIRFRVEAEECTSWATDAASKAKYQKSKGKRCGDGLDFVLEPLRVVVARSVQPRQLGEARPREHARLHDALREHDAARHRCLRGLPVPRRDGHRHMSLGSYKTGALRRRP